MSVPAAAQRGSSDAIIKSMSSLSPRLQLRVAQKQILTPGLVQMVTVLQLNRLELRDMIGQELAENPVLEEAADGAPEELTPEELLPLLEQERVPDPADQQMMEAVNGDAEPEAVSALETAEVEVVEPQAGGPGVEPEAAEAPEAKPETDPFDEIDFGSFFDDYLDPGYRSPSSEQVEKPSFETFLSSPVTLGDHLRSQLSLVLMSDEARDAAESIIGNLTRTVT